MKKFQRIVHDFYVAHKREHLPWRPPSLPPAKNGFINPYAVLVSEIMLQQTQVDRVIPKFNAWMKQFPTIPALARATLKDVLKAWQGLGYNRRGMNLHRLAGIVEKEHGGILPKGREALKALPGIGDYTSGAVMAFAWNEPVIFIETNIRSVFIHHFFEGHGEIHDSELLPIIEKALDRDNPREWYYALMDYGSHIKKLHGNPNKKSRHYIKQSKFEGSRRELRSTLLKYILEETNPTQENILKTVQSKKWNVEECLDALVSEGFIQKKNNRYKVA